LRDDAGREAIEAEEEQGDSGSIDGEGTPVESANIAEEEMAADLEAEVVALPENHIEEATEEEAAAGEVDLEDDGNPDARWYVVHTYSGHENKVATNLRQKIASEHLEAFIFDILVPTQDKIEIRAGKKEAVKEKIFPGYILVKMVLGDNSWLAVRTTPGVTSFVGMGNKPTPIPSSEVKSIVRFMTQGAISPTFKDVFLADDPVKIIDGPFAQFIGKVESVDKDHGKVKVLVSIFGRETPVELDFLQVQKL
jgi:transcriptional antiterminator NusG